MEDNLENFFDSLLHQLEYELSHLSESNNLIVSPSCSPAPTVITTIAPSITSPPQQQIPPSLSLPTCSTPLSTSNRSSYYENNDEISYNLLTASQIQRIIDHYKLLINDSHHNDEPMEVKWEKKGKKNNDSNGGIHNLIHSNLFGCDVNDIEKAHGGLILPSFIENALLYLVRYGINSVGIFRKSGVKSRITSLRQKLESMTGSNSTRSNDYPTINGTGVSTLPRNINDKSSNLYQMGLGNDSGSSTIKYRLSSSYAPGEEFCVYDVADMVKMWLREIKPRPLITKEVIAAYKEIMSTNLRETENGYPSSNSPSSIDLSLKLTVLLTDAQRALLEIFLHFLSLFAANSEVNQMNSQNLAICFTPSLCECSSINGNGIGGGSTNTTPMNSNMNCMSTNNYSSNGNHNNGLLFGQDVNGLHTNGGSSIPRSADTEIIFDAQKCLQYLIDNCASISMIPLSSLPLSSSPSFLNDGGNNNMKPAPKKRGGGESNYDIDQAMDTSYDDVDHLSTIMPSLSLSNGDRYHKTTPFNGGDYRFQTNSPSNPNVINGGNLLPSTYESSIIVNAAPIDILKRILYQRNLFDPSVVEWRIIKQTPNENSDLYEFKVQSSFFLPLKTFTIERKWSFIENQPLLDHPASSSTLNHTISSSSSSSTSPLSSKSFYSSLRKPKPNKNTFKGIILRETGFLYDSWWKIGTSGEGKCQLDISIAVDLRGHSFYWYTNTFPAIIDWQLNQIKQSFLVDFIETKNFKSSNV